MDENKRSKYLSIGRKMPGMADWGQNSTSGIAASKSLRKLIKQRAEERGEPIHIVVKGNFLESKSINVSKASTWEDKLDALGKKIPSSKPCYLLIFRETDALLITYIPELVPPREKMIYASSKFGLKVVMSEQVEEFNVSSEGELTYAEYSRRKTTEAPLTEAEQYEKEYEKMETAGSYSLLARLVGKKQPVVGLPGLAKGLPDALKEKSEENNEDVQEMEANSDMDDEALSDVVDMEDDAEDNVEKRKSTSSRKENEPPAQVVESPKEKTSKVKELIRMTEIKKEEGKAAISKLTRRLSGKISRKGSNVSDEKIVVVEKSPEVKRYSCTKLKKLKDTNNDLDKTKLEDYLTKKSFEKHFEMSREEFKLLPKWKQVMLKRKVGLF